MLDQKENKYNTEGFSRLEFDIDDRVKKSAAVDK